MNHSEARKEIFNTLVKKLTDADMAEEFVSNIDSIGDQYSLTLGEIGEVYDLIDKIIREEVSQSSLLKNLLQTLEVTEEEIIDIAKLLEKEILKPLEEKGVIEQSKADSEIKDIEQKLEMVNKEISKRSKTSLAN